MSQPGARTWYIADAYLPSSGLGESWEGHESVCILNPGRVDANVRMSLLLADRDPIEGIHLTVPARRCLHVGMHKPEQLGGVTVPRDVPYGIELIGDQPVVVQYSRLDVTQPNFTLMTTIPYACD
jgi:hypothetical protein